MKRTKILTGCLLTALLAVGVGRNPAAVRAIVTRPMITLAATTSDTPASSAEFALEIEGDPHPLSAPIDVAVDRQGHLYMVDCKHNRIQKFDRHGQFLTMWGRRGAGDGEFQFTFGLYESECLGSIAVDGEGNVYVAEPVNARIQKFDSEGNFLAKWEGEGHEDGQFIVPISVAVDREDNVYVLDRNRDDVQKFDGQGRFLSKWKANTLACYGELAVDSQGYVYTTGWDCSRVQKFDREGNRVAEWGPGPGDGHFAGPWGVAVDGQDNVYIADERRQHIQKFDSEGNFMAKWGTLGTGDGQFRAPCGLAVNGAGDVYVADFANDRVQKLQQQ